MPGPDAADGPNYDVIEPPATVPPTEYSTEERRAQLLRIIFDRGGPERLNQTELAERFGVAQSTVSRDVDALGEYVGTRLDDNLKLTTRALYERVVGDLLAEDDWRANAKAWTIHAEFVEWTGVDLAENAAEDGDSHQDARSHELTDQQVAMLDRLKQRSRAAITERDVETATVPDSADES